jgi:Putative transposase DNA-binding domain
MPIRTYRYLAKPESRLDEDLMRDQMRLATAYRRQLAKIENGLRRAISTLYRDVPAIAWREDKLDLAYRYRAAVRGDQIRTKVWDQSIAQISAELKKLRAIRARSPEHKAALAEMRGRRPVVERAARAIASRAGLYWGTYLTVEEAHEHACRTTPPWAMIKVRYPHDSVAVQVQAPRRLSGGQLRRAEDTRLRLEPDHYALGPTVNGYAPRGMPGQRNRRGDSRPESFQRLCLRVGSGAHRAPIWTHLHILTGRGGSGGRAQRPPRQIPDDGSVLWARVLAVRVGTMTRWEAQFVVNEPTRDVKPGGDAVVGIDIGWRRVAGGVRVALASTSYGAVRELVIPDVVLARATRADEIRSQRDRRSAWVREVLIERRGRPDAPSWLAAETEHVHLWRRSGRIVHLLRRARNDPTWPWPWIIVGLDAWRKEDARLLDWEAQERRRLRLQVTGRQRQWIHEVLVDCAILGVEKTIRIDRMRGRATSDDEGARQAAVAHSEVSAGRLRAAAVQMARNRGIAVVEVNPKNTTRTCGGCGVVRDYENGKPLVLACSACGREEDQDLTAARVLQLAARAEIRHDVPSPLAAEDSKEDKKKRTISPIRRNRKRVAKAPTRSVGPDQA